mgnify:CR=1 FL=1
MMKDHRTNGFSPLKGSFILLNGLLLNGSKFGNCSNLLFNLSCDLTSTPFHSNN